MFLFFYGQMRQGKAGWEELSLKQESFTECLDTDAWVNGRLLDTGAEEKALLFDMRDREIVRGELHKLLPMNTIKENFLLDSLNENLNYQLEKVILHKPKIEAWAWTALGLDSYFLFNNDT